MKEKKSVIREFFNTLWIIIKSIFLFIYHFFYSIRFIFSLPAITFAAGVFAFCIVMLIKPVINLLPDALNVGFVETFIGAIIFVFLKFILFKDKYLHDDKFDPKKALMTYAFTVLLWLIPIIFFIRDAEYAGMFLAEGRALTFPGIIYVGLYYPHMWLATITQDFVYSVGIGLVINSIIFIIISVCYMNFSE